MKFLILMLGVIITYLIVGLVAVNSIMTGIAGTGY